MGINKQSALKKEVLAKHIRLFDGKQRNGTLLESDEIAPKQERLIAVLMQT